MHLSAFPNALGVRCWWPLFSAWDPVALLKAVTELHANDHKIMQI